MTDLLGYITEPLQYAFMVRGIFASVLVGTVCAVVGCYVVLRGMAFFGDALAHCVLPGVAVGYLFSGGSGAVLFVCGLIAALVAALGIGAVSRGSKLKEDTSIGIIFAGMFALGIAIISSVRNYAVDLAHFLFGNVLGVSSADLAISGVVGLGVVAVVITFYKEFLVISFDPVLATTLRLPAKRLYYLLLVLIAVTIVVSLQTVGIALMIAMLVTPAATAQLITRRLPTMMAWAAGIGAVSGVAGLYVSYYAGISSGAAIVLICTAIFAVVFVGQRLRQRAG